METFWMIWNEKGTAPRVKHTDIRTDPTMLVCNHTPGPWEAVGNTVRINRRGDDDHHIEVCTLAPYLMEGKANAALIAAACNCHDELVAACKAAAIFIRNGVELGFIRMPDEEVPDPAHLVPGMLEAAIAKAERGKEADHE